MRYRRKRGEWKQKNGKKFSIYFFIINSPLSILRKTKFGKDFKRFVIELSNKDGDEVGDDEEGEEGEGSINCLNFSLLLLIKKE